MIRRLSLEDIEFLAHTLATELMTWDEPIPPFRTRYPEKLESCINVPFQTFGNKQLYRSLEEKAAVLFYLIIKDHPFQNGNKRIAVTSLLVFLKLNGKWISVDEQQLYNFAVWVAQSPALVKEPTLQATVKFVSENLVDSV